MNFSTAVLTRAVAGADTSCRALRPRSATARVSTVGEELPEPDDLSRPTEDAEPQFQQS